MPLFCLNKTELFLGELCGSVVNKYFKKRGKGKT
jgi:hypothetical protein